MIKLDKSACTGCGMCERACPFGAISMVEGYPVISDECKGCNACAAKCKAGALDSGEEKEAAVDKSNYRGIWVAGIENDSRKLSNVTLELLSKAVQLSAANKAEVTLVLTADEIYENWKKDCESVGCKNILMLKADGRQDDPDFRTGALTQAIFSRKPEIVLFPATADGRDLAPKTACRLRTGLTADCTGLDIDDHNNLLQIRPTYGGSIMATICTPNHRPQMASVRPGVFDIIEIENRPECSVVVFDVEDEVIFGRIKHLRREENNASFANLDEAEIVVVGGYGMGSKENFQLLYKLADKIGAAVATTRKVVDEGWAAADIQVGQTGRTIAPALYIAFGVSGALQHTLGMKKSQKIIAVNNDPAAPIFGICDRAVLGDAVSVIKEMLKIL